MRISLARAILLGAALGALGCGCSRDPGEVREWRATDHDHAAQPRPGQVEVGDAAPGTGVPGLDDVTLAAWKQSCVPCHGIIGRGDGPRGASAQARDLTDPALQASLSDEQIATAIREGKGKMPRFDLPANVVSGLTRLVRLLNAERARHPGGPSGAPAGGDGGTRP